MTRHTLCAVALMIAASASLLSAADYFTGERPMTIRSVLDDRTPLERLEDEINEMSFFLDEAIYALDEHQAKITELMETIEAQQAALDKLDGVLAVDEDSVTLSAKQINLVADNVDIDAGHTHSSGDLEVDDPPVSSAASRGVDVHVEVWIELRAVSVEQVHHHERGLRRAGPEELLDAIHVLIC